MSREVVKYYFGGTNYLCYVPWSEKFDAESNILNQKHIFFGQRRE